MEKPGSSRDGSHRPSHATGAAAEQSNRRPQEPRSGTFCPSPPASIRSSQPLQITRQRPPSGTPVSFLQAPIQLREYLGGGNSLQVTGIVPSHSLANLPIPSRVRFRRWLWLNTAQNPVSQSQALIWRELYRLRDYRFHRFTHVFIIRLAFELSRA